MTNLILSAAVGYKFNQVELFIKSLRKFYFDKLCLIINNKDTDLEQQLREIDCDVIKTNIKKKEIQFKRYQIFLDYIKDKKFNQILLCDSRDIYFQDNPFNFNFNSPINFFLEDYQIKNCPYNSNWIIKTFGQIEFSKISNETILCSGTVLGNYNKINEYLGLMVSNIKKFKYKKKLKYLLTFRPDPEGRGCDQGHANHIVHRSKIKDFSLYNNHDGPVATVFYLKDLRFNDDLKLINNNKKPYLIVHQYDKRWNNFSKVVSNLKKELNIG